MMSIFNNQEYIALFLEYAIEDMNYTVIHKDDDDDNNEYKKPLIFSAYAVAGIIFIIFCVFFIRFLVKCHKRKNEQIKLMGEAKLSDDKDQTAIPNDLEKGPKLSESSV